ncbi:MAG: hypothetical protein SOZ59_02470 [Candidatus Limivivens sp.]|nr:hypothetical protein [Candidatus Limivivens sp.]
MLHIILVILKIAGLILLAVLALLLLAVLLVLFAPLRYRVEIRYGPTDYGGSGSLCWLGRLIRLEGSFSRKEGLRASLKAAWFQLFQVPGKGTGTAGRKKKPKASVKKSPENKVKKTSKPKEREPVPGKAEKPAGGKAPSGSADKVEQKTAAPEKNAGRIENTTDKKEGAHAGSSGNRRFSERIRALVGRIRTLAERIRRIPEKFREMKRRLQSLGRRIGTLKNRLSHYLEILREEETRNLILAGKDHLLSLWKHFRPRRATGFLRFGFEDPSVTGQAAGILYLLLSSPGNEIALYPEFNTEQRILEGELSISGRIRLCHVVKSGLFLFFNKDLRHFIKRIKEK